MNKSILRVAITSLGLAAAQGAMGQDSPFYVGIAQAFTRESNLFRVATGQPETSDSYSTTSLLAGINQPFGRQRFFTDAAVRQNLYADNDQLDNTAHSLAAGLDWETIEQLSGRLGYTHNRALARFGADQGPALTTKNQETNQEFYASAQYGRVSLLALEGTFKHRRLDYSAPEFAFAEFEQDALGLGLLYRPSGLLTLGIAGRHTKGRYPFAIQVTPGVFQQDDFDRNDVDLTAVWVPSDLSTVRARLSYTKESHEAVASRDISGATGAIRWDYKPTGKLTFTTDLIRDTGAESSFQRTGQDSGGTTSIGDTSELATIVLFRTLYEATAKIQVQLNARYVKRDLVNTFALSSGSASVESGTDELGAVRLGLNWAPTRSLLLGCGYGYEKRRASSAVSYGYTAKVAGCFGQFKVQ